MRSDGAPARPVPAIGGEADASAGTPPKAVLLVDNEHLVCDVVGAALEDGGYTVVATDNGRAALLLLNQRIGDFRALVVDVDLGLGPTGWDVARLAREIDPGLPVVYISAAGLHEHLARGVSNSIILGKPFGVADILAEVSALIGAAT
jgi:DNA-binding response OmpR family regulator